MDNLINLKAFIKNQKKIVYVINVNYSTRQLSYYDSDGDVVDVDVDDVKVLVGSGFKDAEGNEIFEGDVLVRADEDDDEVLIVERHGYSSNIFLRKYSTGSRFNIELFVSKRLKIIGNIYDVEEE